MFRPDFEGTDETTLLSSGEIWVVDDWYTYLDIATPDKIFNIHRAPFVHPDTKHRFINWKQRYNEAVSRGSKVIVTERIPDVNGQVYLDTDRLLKEFKPEYLKCSISTMIGEAVLSGAESIILMGVRLRKDEYKYQIYGINGMINEARARGVGVFNSREEEWGRYGTPIVNWGELHDIVPYWMRGRDA